MIEASNAPAVPGAKGEKPEPKPVPIKTGRKEGLFINSWELRVENWEWRMIGCAPKIKVES